ncbi:MAG: P-loop NTPase fold protein [Kiritimatiellaceae bacterium]|nr:P-loop NTPase fold protein [Kiritimatiellaceae bacterium]
MNKPRIPEFTVLSDHLNLQRGSVASQDLFDLKARLGPMFDILRHKDTVPPLSLALYGSAGTGKTTALRWLEEQISAWNEIPAEERAGHFRVLPVWFTATDCSGNKCAVRQLVSTIIFKCLEHLPNESLREGHLQMAGLKCSGALGDEFLGRLRLLAMEWGLDCSLVPEAGAAGWDTSYGSCLEFVAQWLKGWEDAGDPIRIVPLIDDLDHCRAERMMEILDAMAGMLKSPAFVFVAGLDPIVAQKLVARHYKEHGYGEAQIRHYLGKVFQGECHIEPNPQQIRNFYDEQFGLLNARTNQLLDICLPEAFNEYVDAAIMHLSGANPRKIKMLLNSAMMKASAAGRSKEGEQPCGDHFAQRIQLYLLQRWLSFFSVGASAIYRKDVQEWFEKLSQEAAKPDSEYARVIIIPTDQDDVDPYQRALRNRGRYNETSNFDPPEGLSFNMIPEWVWNLLKIPFDAKMTCLQVMASEMEDISSAVEKVVVAPESSEAGLLVEASSILKDAMAAALEKSADTLTDSDVGTVEYLDFSGNAIPETDLPIIGKMEKIKRLDLHNSGIQDLSWIPGLKHLQRINLTCTPIIDLTPLVELECLEQLDLSYTTVNDLSPLAGMVQLVQLVLYGATITSLEGLRGMQGLQRLNLSHTDVSDADLPVLESLPALNHLFLRGTSVSGKAANELHASKDYALQIEI